VADLHIKCLTYRGRYLEYFKNNSLTYNKDEPDLESLFANNKQLIESFYPALGDYRDPNYKQNAIMESTDVGVVRLPLKEVKGVTQVG
jgi:hypothetical protein